MKQRKVTKGVLEIVSQHINISFEYLYKLYKDGYLNDKRIFQFLEKALYQQGKIKKKPYWVIRKEKAVRKFLNESQCS